MTEVEKWIWKHYTKENSDSVKCNYCEKVLSEFFLSDPTHYLIFHLWDEHNITELDEHPERDNIQQNYKILKWKMVAVCNHCKKTINFAIHGVHVLTIHLKIKHSTVEYNLRMIRRKLSMDKSLDRKNFNELKVKKKHTRVWNMYDEVGDNKLRCKACKRHIKKFTTFLHYHLRRCSIFKSYDPIKLRESSIWDKYDQIDDKYVSCKGCKKPIRKYYISITKLGHHLSRCSNGPYKRKKRIWDKYDKVDENHMSCKGCNKTIKMNNLYQHLYFCLNSSYKIRKKKTSILDKFDKVDENHISCKGCKKTLKLKNSYPGSNIYKHLYYCPNSGNMLSVKLKLRKLGVWDTYDEVDANYVSCKGCKKTIKINSTNVTTNLIEHLHFCPNVSFKMKEERRIVWDKYDEVDENHMSCKGCKNIIKLGLFSISNLIKHLHFCPSLHTESEDLCEASTKSKAEAKVNLRKTRINVVDEFYSNSDSDRKIWEILKKAKAEAIIQDSRKKETNVNSSCRKERRGNVWNMFDEVDDNCVTCKGCKKIIKIKNSSFSKAYINKHLHFCPSYKEEQKRESIWDKYDEVDDNRVNCKGCKKIIKISNLSYPTSNLYQHLNFCPNNRNKLSVRQRKSGVWDMYDEVDDNYASCKGCKKAIKINSIYSTSNLNKHLRCCPYGQNNYKLKVKQDEKRKDVWDVYDKVDDNYMCCKKCKKIIKMNSRCPTTNLNNHLLDCRL